MRVRWNSMGLNLLRETELKKRLELNQIKHQIEILSTFLPDQILQMQVQEMQDVRTFVGVLLFADVSGFTPLCEKYTKSGKGGIYRLTATLNAYIGAMVEVIYFYGGDVLKFSGDAFLALWTAPPDVCLYEVIHQVSSEFRVQQFTRIFYGEDSVSIKVIVCALFIQQTLGYFATEVNVMLKVKLAISSGNLMFSVIGNESDRNYVILGQAINDVKNAEHGCVSGDVVLAPSAWGHLSEENYEVTYAERGNVKVWKCLYSIIHSDLQQKYAAQEDIALKLCALHLENRQRLHRKKKIEEADTDSIVIEEFVESLPKRVFVKKAPQTWVPHQLNPFVVSPVENQVSDRQPIEYLTEMRQVTIQFINIIPLTYQESKLVGMVNKAYQIVCGIVSRVKGVVNKVSLFDKDAMMLVLFGLRGVKHELESQNALKSAYEIRTALSRLTSVRNVSIGISNGLVYCGVVGHPFRREYTVIGGAVNKAARLMCAYPNKVTCDHETYKSCKLSSLYFQLLSSVQLKGIENAGHIFEYNESFQTQQRDVKETFYILGRDKELEFIELLITNPQKAGWHAVCFKGETKVGKTILLKTAYEKFENTTIMLSLTLNSMLNRPYYTVSTMYRHLYDKLLEKKEPIVTDLPRDLWDLNDVLQSRSSTTQVESATVAADYLTKLCKSLPSKYQPIFFIDNVHYIDKRSLEVFDQALRNKCLRLICAGSFEDHKTWSVMWKMSLSNQIKLLTLESLKNEYIVPLMCQLLNVRGASKRVLGLVLETCENRPGWIQTCILTLINNSELEVKYVVKSDDYVFEEGVNDTDIYAVATFSKKYLDRSQNITLAAISLDLFDSFSLYQQLIIKTAAVLGDIFTRTILLILLQFPNEEVFAPAMKLLFDEDIFECGSRYINSDGLYEKKLSCQCYRADESNKLCKEYNLPKYAFCRLIYFKSKNIRTIAYELLPQNQKKELHMKITDLLENQNNSCPNCLHDNSASILSIRKFGELISYCHGEKYTWNQAYVENYATEDFKDIIRKGVQGLYDKKNTSINTLTQIPKRRIWDPTTCFCLEILTKVYRDLVYHSQCAGHLGKRIFFMTQYGYILLMLNEFQDGLPILTEASEVCMAEENDLYVFTGAFQRIMLAKIHSTLGMGYLRCAKLPAAKNHAMLSLRQFGVPMISFTYTLPNIFLTSIYLKMMKHTIEYSPKLNSSIIKVDFGHTLSLISHIFATEGNWKLAKATALRSLYCLRQSNANIDILADVYCTALDLHGVCGQIHLCEKLERSFYKDSLRFFTNNVTCELFYLSKLLNVMFLVKVMSGNLAQSTRLGYRAINIHLSIQTSIYLLEVAPVLASLLLMIQRIDEAVCMARTLFSFGKKYHFQGYIAYYSFCMELILDTNFELEPFEQIETFAAKYVKTRSKPSHLGYKLMLFIHVYIQRNHIKTQTIWMEFYDLETDQHEGGIISVFNLLRYTESCLLDVSEGRTKTGDLTRATHLLKMCRKATKSWKVLEPRYLHYMAYFHKLKNNNSLAVKYLKRAATLASKQENMLEECWSTLHLSFWTGGFSFSKTQREPINWKSAKSYSPLQWCHILYALPIN